MQIFRLACPSLSTSVSSVILLRYYAKTMERIQAKGKKWVGKEIARLDRMLAEGKLSAEKKYAATLTAPLRSSPKLVPSYN